VVRKAVRVNGVDAIALTKLDVLDGLDTLRICTGYRRGSQVVDDVPALAEELDKVKPVYEDHPGWREPLGAYKRLEELPAAARSYVARLQELCGVPIELVSVGADRADTIRIAPLFG
jgi:adenylosuccinate synthase